MAYQYALPQYPQMPAPPQPKDTTVWVVGLIILLIIIVIGLVFISNVIMVVGDPYSGYWAAPEPYSSTGLQNYTIGTPGVDLQKVLFNISKTTDGYNLKYTYGVRSTVVTASDGTQTVSYSDGSTTQIPGTYIVAYTSAYNGLSTTGDTSPTMVYNYNIQTGVEELNIVIGGYTLPFSRVIPNTNPTSPTPSS